MSGGISQRSASEAKVPGDKKSPLPREQDWGTTTCEEVKREELKKRVQY